MINQNKANEITRNKDDTPFLSLSAIFISTPLQALYLSLALVFNVANSKQNHQDFSSTRLVHNQAQKQMPPAYLRSLESASSSLAALSPSITYLVRSLHFALLPGVCIIPTVQPVSAHRGRSKRRMRCKRIARNSWRIGVILSRQVSWHVPDNKHADSQRKPKKIPNGCHYCRLFKNVHLNCFLVNIISQNTWLAV